MGRARESGAEGASVEPGARCVVLHAGPDARHPTPVPPELEESLDRRGVRRVRASNAFEALAEVCAIDPRSGSRIPSALLIVEPRRSAPRDTLARLVAAVRRHAPEVSVWRYERDSTPPLRAIEPDAMPAADATEPDPTRRRQDVIVRKGVAPPRPPALRIAPESIHAPDAPLDLESPAPPTSAPPPPLLSDEELAMLLADEPHPRGGPSSRLAPGSDTP